MSDLQSLKDFLVLARVQSFTRAAEHCHVSTSGLSRRIQNLEAWVGAPLFERGKGPLALTDDGRRLAQAATDAVATLEAVRHAVRRRTGPQNRQVRIAAPHVMSSVFFPSWLPRLYSAFGQMRFNVTAALLPECMALLDEGEVDFVVAFVDPAGAIATRVPGLQEPRVERRVIDAETLVPVSAPAVGAGARHPLTQGGRVSFLAYSADCSLGWALDAALAERSDLPERVCEHGSSLAENLRLMALAGLGAAWLPTSLVREDLAARRLVRAAPPGFDVALSIQVLRAGPRTGSRADEVWQALAHGDVARAASEHGATTLSTRR